MLEPMALKFVESISYDAAQNLAQLVSLAQGNIWTGHFPKCASGTDLPLTVRDPSESMAAIRENFCHSGGSQRSDGDGKYHRAPRNSHLNYIVIRRGKGAPRFR